MMLKSTIDPISMPYKIMPDSNRPNNFSDGRLVDAQSAGCCSLREAKSPPKAAMNSCEFKEQLKSVSCVASKSSFPSFFVAC